MAKLWTSSFFLFVFVSLASCLVPSCTLTVETDSLSNGVCKTNFKACNGKCVSATSTEFGCGTPNSCVPCSLSHATPICSSGGKCSLSKCESGYSDCNKNETDGCEIETDFDELNCGDCMNVCPKYPNADRAQCSRGFCTAGICKSGFGDCDTRANTGCETDLNTTLEHCGRCNNNCATMGLTMCVLGVCK